MASYEEKNSSNLSLEEEAARQQKYLKRNHLWSILLLVAAFAFFVFGGTDLEITPDKEEITVKTPDFEVVIDHDNVTAIGLVTEPDYGTCVSGQSDGSVWYGQWENEAWGEYQLGVNAKVNACVVIVQEQGTVVINFASENETQALYEYMQACCEGAEEIS